MQPNPESVSLIVTRLRRLFRDAYGQELRIAQPRPGFPYTRVEIVIRNALSSVSWPPKPRLKSGIYNEKEYSSAWAAIDQSPDVQERRGKLKEIENRLKEYGKRVKNILSPDGSLILDYAVKNWDYYPNRHARFGLSVPPMTADTLREARDQLLGALDRAIEGYSAFLDPRLYDGKGTAQDAVALIQGKNGVQGEWLERYLRSFWGIEFPYRHSEKYEKYCGMNAPDPVDILQGRRSLDDLARWREAKNKEEEKKSIEYANTLIDLNRALPRALSGMVGKKPTLGNLTRFAPRVRLEMRAGRGTTQAVIFVDGEWTALSPISRQGTEGVIALVLRYAPQISQEIEKLKRGTVTDEQFRAIADKVRYEITD